MKHTCNSNILEDEGPVQEEQVVLQPGTTDVDPSDYLKVIENVEVENHWYRNMGSNLFESG